MNPTPPPILRPVAAHPLRGVKPAPDPGQPPEVRWVDPTVLLVDETYQRALSHKSITLIREIIANFDWAAFNAPTVVETPQGLKVTNGQHSAIAAASHPLVTQIPVLVSAPRALAAEAEAFLSQNKRRLALTSPQAYISAVAAEDPQALALARILADTGTTVLRNPKPKDAYRPGETIAVETLARLLHRRGPETLREYLTLLASRAPILALELQALDTLKNDPDFRARYNPALVAPIVAASSDYERHEAEAIAATRARPRYYALALVWARRLPNLTPSAPTLLRRRDMPG